jgi:hypothetical protein
VAVARRVYLFLIAFVALGVLVTGLTGLAEVAVLAIAERMLPALVEVGQPDVRGRVSFSGALGAIGLVTWLIHWWLADRPVRRGGADGASERTSAMRKLFLYAVLLVGGLILLFALRALVEDGLSTLFGLVTRIDLIAGRLVSPASLLVVVGAFWLYHWRVASADRLDRPERGAGASLRRWFVYVLAFVALVLLLFGAAGLIGSLWERAAVSAGAATLGEDRLSSVIVSWLSSIGAGLCAWLLPWRWSSSWMRADHAPDQDHEARSVLRKVYLYLVLGLAMTWTVWNAGRVLYGLLRTLLLGERAAAGWGGFVHDLGGPVAFVLVFGLCWLYHARVVGHEAGLADEPARQAAIRWLYGYLASLVGVVTFAFGIGGTAATVLDLIVQPDALRPTFWAEERISLFATLALVGLPLWSATWGRLQREAATPLARASLVRRVYLLLVFALAVLTLLTSGVYALYEVMRAALGESWSAGQITDVLSAASAAAVAGLLLLYHVQALQRDAGQAAQPADMGPPAYAAVLLRATDRTALAAADRRLAGIDGLGVELHEIDEKMAARLRNEIEQETRRVES